MKTEKTVNELSGSPGKHNFEHYQHSYFTFVNALWTSPKDSAFILIQYMLKEYIQKDFRMTG